MKKGNYIAAALFAAFALFVIWESASFPPSKARVPGPAVFPTIIAVVMLMASLSLILTTLRMAPEENRRIALNTPDTKRVYACMGILVVYTVLVPLIGFVTVSSVLMFGLIKWFGKYRFHICAVSALALSFFIYFIFSHVLHVPFRFGFLL